MLMNKESLTLYRTHDIEPFNLEDWDYDEDSVHPNFYKFKRKTRNSNDVLYLLSVDKYASL